MNFYNIFICLMIFMFVSGLLVMCFNMKHMLLTLLGLEYMSMCVFLIMVYIISMYMGELYILLIFLTFSVCEAVLGLSVLVSMVRCYGSDWVGSLVSLLW